MSHIICRRDFIALSATVGAGVAMAGFAPAPAAAAPPGDVLDATVGVTLGDRNPFASPLTRFGDELRLALDYDYRSVGADLGSVQRVTAVELVPETAVNRLNSRDFSVYSSNDNATWSKVSGVEMVDLGASLWLYGFDAKARYVKVHCHRGETTGQTFRLANMQTAVRVHRLGGGQFVGSGGGRWRYRTPITVTNETPESLRDRAVYVSFAALGVEQLVAAGRLESDLRDLRFADAAGRELHAYADGSGVFVRVPEIGGRRSLPVFAHSGNPAAVDRVGRDIDALQVQYGTVTLDETDSARVFRLPDGTMMLTRGGPRARYSSDNGRTWSDPEPMIPGVTNGGPSGGIVDPETGVLTFVYRVVLANSGPDWTDPEQHHLVTFVVQADSYTSEGRPIFGEPQQLRLELDGRDVNYVNTATSPVRTRSGAYLLPMSHIIEPSGTFALIVVRSTDGGATWVQSPSQLTLSATEPPALGGWVSFLEAGVSENGLAQLSDGRILMYTRQQSPYKNHFAVTESTDDGVTWTPVTDSTILASNTQPELRGGQGSGLVLTFPGHNAFSQESYWRNNFTAAYSDDDARSWHGYHDLLAGTALSTPGWAGLQESRRVVNPSSASAGDTDRFFAYTDWTWGNRTLLVEDFDRYLRDSHGALDVIGYRNPDGAGHGTELAQSRWWRSLRAGTLDLVPGSRPGRQAVRLRTTPRFDTAASRLFPAIRTGSVRFALRWSQLAGGLRLCLQEAFADRSAAAGTVLSLRLAPNGDLLATGRDPVSVNLPLIGHSTPDPDPATGNLASINYKTFIPQRQFDFNNCSIGADLLERTEVSGLQLVDGNEVLHGDGTRLEPGDLQVWWSDTNAGDWQPVAGWSAVKDGHLFTLTGPAVTTRYIKVHQPYADTAYTFSHDQNHLLRVLPDPATSQPYAPLPKATRIARDDWHLVQFDVDLPRGSTAVTIDGVQRAILPQLSAADVVTHLLVYLEEAEGRSEIALDELIVQDTAKGLPTVRQVGPTTPA